MTDASENPEHELGKHLAPVVAYMERNHVSRMQLTIEHSAEAEPRDSSVLVLSSRHRVLEDDTTPSDLGLGGVFIVVASDGR